MSSNFTVNKVCEHCQKIFTAKTTVTRFCSHVCNSRNYKQKLRNEKIAATKQVVRQVISHQIEELASLEFLSVKSAAKLLGATDKIVYTMIRSGRLKATNLSVRKTVINGISEATVLCHAPFFNIYKDGKVCMGNVKINIPKDCGLEDFMCLWQDAFFNSYFSHMMQGHNPVKGNMVQLWNTLVGTRKHFPLKSLIPLKATIKNLIP